MAGPLVVGVGGSGSGVSAALTAGRVASMMQTPLVLVFGYEPSPLGGPRGTLRDEIEVIGDEACAAVAAAVAAEYPDVVIEVELVQDRPVEALIRVAQDRGAEAIVVGHGGSGPLRAALLGSITYEIVHRAPLPVLVVPDADE